MDIDNKPLENNLPDDTGIENYDGIPEDAEILNTDRNSHLDTRVDVSPENDVIMIDELSAMSDDEFMKFSLETLKSKVKEDKPVPEKKDTATVDKPVDDSNKPVETKPTETATEDTSIDYKEAYNKLFTPFKANGKEIKLDSVDEAIALMQMGANYAKKMAIIKPMKKIVQTIDNAKISEDDLNFLIDVHNGDKEAIKKLVKKHNIEPIDLDTDDVNYQPKDNIAKDKYVDFSLAVEEIKESPNFDKTQDVIMKQWDDSSKKKIVEDSSKLIGLHEEVASGRYDIIQGIVDKQRMLGRLNGLDSFDAYVTVLHSYLNNNDTQTDKPKPTNTKPIVTEESKKIITDNKKSAAPSKANTGVKNVSTITAEDILSMSDDEFSKIDMNKILKG